MALICFLSFWGVVGLIGIIGGLIQLHKEKMASKEKDDK